jgi:hypothetical protein
MKDTWYVPNFSATFFKIFFLKINLVVQKTCYIFVPQNKYIMSNTTTRPLYEIAREIRSDWSKQGKGINYGAKPYLDAMASLDSIDSNYGADSAKSVVCYFLANAGTYRGETAKRVKAELKKMAGIR